MKTKPLNLYLLLVPAIVVTAIAIFLVSLPQSREREVAVPTDADLAHLSLDRETTIIQTFQSTGRPIAGLVLFSPQTTLGLANASLTISDQDQTILATGQITRTEYKTDKLALIFNFQPFTAPTKQPLIININNPGTDPISLLVNTASNFTNGELTDHLLAQPDSDLAFSLIHPLPTSPTTKQGLLIGLVALFGAVLIARLPRHQFLAAALLLIITLPLATSGFWFSTDQWGIADWDLFAPMNEGYRQTIADYQTFPFWNPFTFGGVAGLGDPEFPVISISFLYVLLAGVPTGFRLAIYTTLIISSLGMLTLSRRLGLSIQAALLTAIAFPLNLTVLLRFVEGHTQYFAIAWIPWIFAAWYSAYKNKSSGLLTGLFLALTFYQGGIYILFFVLPALFALIWLAGRPAQALRTTIQAGLWSFGLAAFKVLPVLAWIREFPDDFYHVSSFSLPYWTDIFLRRHLHGSTILPNQSGGWHEYGAYLGLIVFGLAILSLSQIKGRRVVRALFIGFAASLLIASAGPALVPIFDQIVWLPRSNIIRLAILSTFTAVLLAGYGLDVIHQHRSRWGKYLAPILVGIVALDLMSLATPISHQAFTVPAVVPPVAAASHPINFTADTRPIRVNGTEQRRNYAATLAGYGTISYRPNTAPPLAAEPDADYLHSSNPTAQLELASWSPNQAIVNVNTEEETTITLNGNYARGWQVNDQSAENNQGRVAATVPAGQHTLNFKYRPAGYPLGLIITLATILLAIIKTSPSLTKYLIPSSI